MTRINYIYNRSDEQITEEWFKKLESVGEVDEWGGELYWLQQGKGSGTTLLELSTCGKKYRYAWWNGKNGRAFDTGRGTSPRDIWLNPEGLVYRDKQPLPFSWRS